jgi:hypothetical protein
MRWPEGGRDRGHEDPLLRLPAVRDNAAMKIQFSIRDLLWLTLVVALIAGWCVDHFGVRQTDAPHFKYGGIGLNGHVIAIPADDKN